VTVQRRRVFEPSFKRRKRAPGPLPLAITSAEEAMIVEFRRRTLLPLDNVMGCLRDAVPTLTRSTLICIMYEMICKICDESFDLRQTRCLP
jgi:hypothetical protein